MNGFAELAHHSLYEREVGALWRRRGLRYHYLQSIRSQRKCSAPEVALVER